MRTRSLLVVLLAGLSGCSAPDRSDRIPDPLPGALLEWLAPDTSRAVQVADGVHYRYLWSARGPFAIHLLDVDLSRCALGFEVGLPASVRGREGGFDQVSDIARDHPRPVIAAVNGDFFTGEGFPVGPEVAAEGVRVTRSRPAVAFRGGSSPWIGTIGVERGSRVVGPDWSLRPESERAGPGGVQVIGGSPELLDGGARVGDLGVEARPGFAASRHPRTAIGIDEDEDRGWLVVVDGRQEGYSVGMSLPELTDLFEALGVEEALNLDGGGSSVMVVSDVPVSRPSDPTGERAVVNALLLVDHPGFCTPPVD